MIKIITKKTLAKWSSNTNIVIGIAIIWLIILIPYYYISQPQKKEVKDENHIHIENDSVTIEGLWITRNSYVTQGPIAVADIHYKEGEKKAVFILICPEGDMTKKVPKPSRLGFNLSDTNKCPISEPHDQNVHFLDRETREAITEQYLAGNSQQIQDDIAMSML